MIPNKSLAVQLSLGRSVLMIKCMELYESLGEEWQAKAQFAYNRLQQENLRDMGDMSNAELAVKLAAFLNTHKPAQAD